MGMKQALDKNQEGFIREHRVGGVPRNPPSDRSASLQHHLMSKGMERERHSLVMRNSPKWEMLGNKRAFQSPSHDVIGLSVD